MDSINASQGDQPLQLPLVVAMHIDIAAEIIKQAAPSLEIIIEHGDSHAPPGTVTAQRPVPGAVLKPGSQVTLWVSVPP